MLTPNIDLEVILIVTLLLRYSEILACVLKYSLIFQKALTI